mmetsp:Transcript_46317/g.88395  ORF Transcript_46317/g.88395 Transcript_46317/m.88395 type:complete len:176 (-) Transcript_46317:1232-1759(-)
MGRLRTNDRENDKRKAKVEGEVEGLVDLREDANVMDLQLEEDLEQMKACRALEKQEACAAEDREMEAGVEVNNANCNEVAQRRFKLLVRMPGPERVEVEALVCIHAQYPVQPPSFQLILKTCPLPRESPALMPFISNVADSDISMCGAAEACNDLKMIEKEVRVGVSQINIQDGV